MSTEPKATLASESDTARWFLSFDPASKTFAHCLMAIDIERYKGLRDWIKNEVKLIKAELKKCIDAEDSCRRSAQRGVSMQKLLDSTRETIKRSHISIKCKLSTIRKKLRGVIVIEDGRVVDLFPGVPDAEISTVQRIKAVVSYIESTVKDTIVTTKRPEVKVEYQSINPKTLPVAAAIIACFHDYSVSMVGPALKNKVSIGPDGDYANFIKKYQTTYSANKAHALYNFRRLEDLFVSKVPKTNPESLRGHIADSGMQILGDLIYGGRGESAF